MTAAYEFTESSDPDHSNLFMRPCSPTGCGTLALAFQPISFVYDGVKFDEGFRADLFVEDSLIIELKSVERLAPFHGKQLLTYLGLTEKPLGLLMNLGAATFKEGCTRVVNNHTAFACIKPRSPTPPPRDGKELNEGPFGLRALA